MSLADGMVFGKAMPTPPRQPLRIPGGWMVEHNELGQMEPDGAADDRQFWICFTEDLLQLRHPRLGLLLDVGWYPDSSPEGEFRAVLLRGEDWESPVMVCETRRLSVLVESIERWMLWPHL